MKQGWRVANNVICRKTHGLPDRNGVVEEVKVCELPTYIGRGLSTNENKTHGNGLWRTRCPTSGRIQHATILHFEKKKKRPCELDIDHLIFVQSLHPFFDLTGLHSTPILP